MLELSPPLQILLLLRVGGLPRLNTRDVHCACSADRVWWPTHYVTESVLSEWKRLERDHHHSSQLVQRFQLCTGEALYLRVATSLEVLTFAGHRNWKRAEIWRNPSSGIKNPSSYFTGDILRLCYRVQPVNAMYDLRLSRRWLWRMPSSGI
jgi:hypothetical protein